eukprot:Gb_11003 [translate_table: standard]
MRPFVSRFRDLGPLSLRLPCARHEYFCVGSMVLGTLLSAWSHSFCQRANLSALVSGFYSNSCPLGGIWRPPGCGCPSLSSSITGPVQGSLPRLEEATEPNVGVIEGSPVVQLPEIAVIIRP